MNLSNLRRFIVFAALLASPLTHAACISDRIFFGGFDTAAAAPLFGPIVNRATVLGDGPISIDMASTLTNPDPSNPLAWSLTLSPLGMSIDAITGVISWTPMPGQQGDHDIKVQVCDQFDHSVKTDLRITVVAPTSPPLISPIDDSTILVNLPFQQQVVVQNTGGAAPIVYSLDQAPPGMQINASSGLITWTPSSANLGSNPVVVHATNSQGQGDTEPFTLTVVTSNAQPILDPIADQAAKPGDLFTITARATDADNDAITYFLPVHPAGMSINPGTGVIRWTPASQHLGPHNVSVRASDPLGFSDTKSFVITIDENRAPVAVDDGPYTVERGDTLSVAAPGVLANDADPNGDPITAVLGTGPTKGVLDFLSDGSFNYTPDNPAGTIGIALKWSYFGRGGVPGNIPVIIDLDGDGVPEIILMDGVGSSPQIYAVHGDTGAEYFRVPYFNRSVSYGTAFAAADIDLDGHPEIIAIGNEPGYSIGQGGKKLMAFEHDGHLKWVSEPLPDVYQTSAGLAYEGYMINSSITIADIDQDGTPEILVGIITEGLGRIGYQVWDVQGNKLDYVYTSGAASIEASTRVEVVDLDLDGVPEIVVGRAAWTNTGELLWSRPDSDMYNAGFNTFPLVANLDDDPYPEMVRMSSFQGNYGPGTIVAWNHDGSTLWTATVPSYFNYGIYGMLSIADVDNDGKPEILVPPFGYDNPDPKFQVLNGNDGSLKWAVPAKADSSGWGAAVMDMDNDGFNEVVYLDRDRIFHVWDGRDGTVKLKYPSGEGGRSFNFSMPIFADVDGDGHAELVTIGDFSLGPDLIRVYESPQDDWPPMRAIWNQNAYHVTNINDDGTVPQFERPHWLLPGLNQNLVNQRLPEERFSTTDSFTYRASDGALQSNLATVDITILQPNSPPQIFSTPRLLASPGFEYTYAVLAVDVDVGEVLTYSLAQAPAGMIIDANHVVRWTPTAGDFGDHPVKIKVADSLGVAVYQNYTLTVTSAVLVPNVVNQAQASAVATLSAASLTANPIDQVFHPTVAVGQVASQTPTAGTTVAAGASVRINVSKGPQPVDVPNVLGHRLPDAQSEIVAAGLSVGAVTYRNDGTVPLGSVITQNPAPHATQLPGGAVDLVISGGPRAVIKVDPGIILAGNNAQVSVSVRAPDGSPVTPQPVVNLSLQVMPGQFTGTPPSLSGTTIQTGATGQGSFQVIAAFNAGMAETIAAPVVVMQPIATGASGNLFGVFGSQLKLFSDLLKQLEVAVAANDLNAIAAIDVQLAALRDSIDTNRLRSMTPVAPDGGVMPSPAIAAANGFPPGPDDLAYKTAAFDVIPMIQALETAATEPSTPPSILRNLNQQFAQDVVAIDQLDVKDYGILDSSVAMVNVVGTRLPLLTVKSIDRIRLAIASAGLVNGPAAYPINGIVGIDGFSFGSVLSSMSIQVGLMNDLYGSFIYQLIRNAVSIAAADLLQNFTNNTSVTGLITGSSVSIHAFKLPNSVIEGFGFNTQLAEANHVFIIGPDLIEAVSNLLNGGLPSVQDFLDLNSLSDNINGVIEGGTAVNEAFNDANSSPEDVLRGCLFDNHPACHQLVYPDGITSVYTATGGFDIPAPVIMIVTNLGQEGGMGVYVATFVPTRP